MPACALHGARSGKAVLGNAEAAVVQVHSPPESQLVFQILITNVYVDAFDCFFHALVDLVIRLFHRSRCGEFWQSPWVRNMLMTTHGTLPRGTVDGCLYVSRGAGLTKVVYPLVPGP